MGGPTGFAPTPTEPSVDFSPCGEGEWTAVVERLRR